MLYGLMASLAFAISVMSPIRAQANYQTCADKFVSMDIVRCPDGAVPHYNIGDPPIAPGATPAAAPASRQTKPASASSEIDALYGVWHTNRPGASYLNGMDVPGSYLLAAKPGLAQGDLTISPNGTFVWNTFSGLSGRWVRSEKSIVLYDESTRTKWRVIGLAGSISISADAQAFTGRR